MPPKLLPQYARKARPLAALLCAWALLTSSVPSVNAMPRMEAGKGARDRATAVVPPTGPRRALVTGAVASTASPPEFGSGIPENVLAAYRAAEQRMAGQEPGCRLTWYHLAGIGKVESGHARGGQADESGDTVPHILGPRLDGGGFAAIPDTDSGVYDEDPVWDRAVGPMQFIPGTWRVHAVDGDDDGTADPHNLYDSTLAAGRYLCSGGLDLSDASALRAAVFRYNNSDAYVRTVQRWMAVYADGVLELPPLPPDWQPEELPPYGPADLAQDAPADLVEDVPAQVLAAPPPAAPPVVPEPGAGTEPAPETAAAPETAVEPEAVALPVEPESAENLPVEAGEPVPVTDVCVPPVGPDTEPVPGPGPLGEIPASGAAVVEAPGVQVSPVPEELAELHDDLAEAAAAVACAAAATPPHAADVPAPPIPGGSCPPPCR